MKKKISKINIEFHKSRDDSARVFSFEFKKINDTCYEYVTAGSLPYHYYSRKLLVLNKKTLRAIYDSTSRTNLEGTGCDKNITLRMINEFKPALERKMDLYAASAPDYYGSSNTFPIHNHDTVFKKARVDSNVFSVAAYEIVDSNSGRAQGIDEDIHLSGITFENGNSILFAEETFPNRGEILVSQNINGTIKISNVYYNTWDCVGISRLDYHFINDSGLLTKSFSIDPSNCLMSANCPSDFIEVKYTYEFE